MTTEKSLSEWANDVCLTIRAIDAAAERITERQQTTWRDGEDQTPREEDFEDIIIGYRLKTGLWHKLLGLLATRPSSLASQAEREGAERCRLKSKCERISEENCQHDDCPLSLPFRASQPAPSAASGLAGWKVERLKRYSFECYSIKAPDGSVAVVSALDRNPSNVLFMLTKEVLRSHQAPVGEDALQAALKALDAFDDDVDMEDYESVAGWWTKRGGPAAITLRECVAKLKQGD